MTIKTLRKCYENDRYLLYILYVLIERFKNKYGQDKSYVRIYKRTRQKNKITAATIDSWIGSNCTKKGMNRLEQNGYIKREQLQSYDKITVVNIPEAEDTQVAFTAESNNPLLDLWEHNQDRKVAKCEICGKKFTVVGARKTCSDKCSKILLKRGKNKKKKLCNSTE